MDRLKVLREELAERGPEPYTRGTIHQGIEDDPEKMKAYHQQRLDDFDSQIETYQTRIEDKKAALSEYLSGLSADDIKNMTPETAIRKQTAQYGKKGHTGPGM